MRHCTVPGAEFPDFGLPDHQRVTRRLSEIQAVGLHGGNSQKQRSRIVDSWTPSRWRSSQSVSQLARRSTAPRSSPGAAATLERRARPGPPSPPHATLRSADHWARNASACSSVSKPTHVCLPGGCRGRRRRAGRAATGSTPRPWACAAPPSCPPRPAPSPPGSSPGGLAGTLAACLTLLTSASNKPSDCSHKVAEVLANWSVLSGSQRVCKN